MALLLKGRSAADVALPSSNYASLFMNSETGRLGYKLPDGTLTDLVPAVDGTIPAGYLPDTDALVEGTTNVFFTAARTLAVALTGFAIGSNVAIASTDNILSAFGKTQAQINAKANIAGQAFTGAVSAPSFTGPLTGDVTGNVTGNASGNAGTATKLATARAINGVAFDGSAPITITAVATNAVAFNASGAGDGSGITYNGSAARTISYNTLGAAPAAGSTDIVTVGTIMAGTWQGTQIANAYIAGLDVAKLTTGTTLPANVTASSLTSVGTITSGVWNGTQVANNYIATITAAGKVANSATTATSANTADAIVTRDGSGNFSAGTITAALTGTASNASQLLTKTWAAPAAIGSTTPAAGTFTSLQATSDLTVDGNLYVNGTVTQVNTDNITVEDPLVKYATANTTDSVDIGWYGLYQPAATPLFTGLFRDATDGKYKLFYGLQTEPTTIVNIAGTGYTVATLVANVEGALTGNVTGNLTGNVTGSISGGTVAGSTGTFSGLVTRAMSAATNGQAFAVTGGTTAASYIGFANTTGNAIFGVEGASTGYLITGATAYDTAISGNGGIAFSANNGGALHMRLSASTFAITPAVTMASTLGVTGAITASGNLINFGAQSGNAPYIQHASNWMDHRSGTNGFRVLNNAATAALVTVVDGGNITFAPTGGGTVAVTGALSATDTLTVGSNASSNGRIRLPNAEGIRWRNAANNNDAGFIVVDAANNFVLSAVNAIALDAPTTVNGSLKVSTTGASQLAGYPNGFQVADPAGSGVSEGCLMVLSNWSGISTTHGAFLAFDNSGNGGWKIGGAKGSAAFDFIPSGTNTTVVSISTAGALTATGDLGLTHATTSTIKRANTAGQLAFVGGTSVGSDGASLQLFGSTAGGGDASTAYYNATTHVFRNMTGGGEYARIVSGGNFGLGVTPSAWHSAFKAIEVEEVGYGIAASPGNAYLVQGMYFDGAWKRSQASYAVSQYNASAGGHYWFTGAVGSVGSSVSLTQAMTLDASGNLLVGTTTQLAKFTVQQTGNNGAWIETNTSAAPVLVLNNSATSGDNPFIAFVTDVAGGGGTTRGTITYNRGGGVTAYNTTSDYRSKMVLGDVTDSGALIDALRPHMVRMHGASMDIAAFVAHELQAVVPYAVTGEKDGEAMQQVNLPALTPLVVAELQSLRARVALLEDSLNRH